MFVCLFVCLRCTFSFPPSFFNIPPLASSLVWPGLAWLPHAQTRLRRISYACRCYEPRPVVSNPIRHCQRVTCTSSCGLRFRFRAWACAAWHRLDSRSIYRLRCLNFQQSDWTPFSRHEMSKHCCQSFAATRARLRIGQILQRTMQTLSRISWSRFHQPRQHLSMPLFNSACNTYTTASRRR